MAQTYSYLLIIFALIFGVSLAFRSNYVNKYKNRYFIYAVLINIGLLLTEIGRDAGQYYRLRWLYILMNIINYGLAPLLPYSIILMNRKCWKRWERLIMIPAVVIVLLSLTSQMTGLLFYIDESNIYSRGPLYVVCLFVSIVYFLLLTTTSFREYRDADFSEKVYLLAILTLALTGVLLQAFLPTIASMWTTTGICLLLYYTFGLEMNNKYDILTGVRNRRAFDTYKENLLPDRNYAVLVFDINGLKPVNDHMGHEQGDKLIMGVAGILAGSFYGIGKIYRIGGDEFCIICDEKNEAKISAALVDMEQNIIKANRTGKYKFTISVSYGTEIHKADDVREYQEVFNSADEKMYEMKQDFYRKNKDAVRREA